MVTPILATGLQSKVRSYSTPRKDHFDCPCLLCRAGNEKIAQPASQVARLPTDGISHGRMPRLFTVASVDSSSVRLRKAQACEPYPSQWKYGEQRSDR